MIEKLDYNTPVRSDYVIADLIDKTNEIVEWVNEFEKLNRGYAEKMILPESKSPFKEPRIQPI